MANTSILAAFERMWQHVVAKDTVVLTTTQNYSDANLEIAKSYTDQEIAETDNKLNNKSDVGHTHENATSSTAGFMSIEDKNKLDNLGNTEVVLITIPTVGWSESSPYTITISVDGVQEMSNPIYYLVPAGNEATEGELNSVNNIKDITVGYNYVTITANEIPTSGFVIALYGLSNDVEYSPADYAALSGRVSGFEAGIETLQNTITNLETETNTEIGALQEQVSNLETTTNATTESLQNQINDLDAEINNINIANFTGATSENEGTSGTVPAPQAGDENKVLKGDGTWGDVSITVDTTLEIEGAAADAKTTGDKIYDNRIEINRIQGDALVVQTRPYMISDQSVNHVSQSQWNAPIVYGNGKYVAVGETHFTTSTDGVNWEMPSLLTCDGEQTAGRYIKGAYGNGKFVFIANDAYYIYNSPIAVYTEDCINWECVVLPEQTEAEWTDIIFENGMFVILSKYLGGGLSPVAYSTDGETWNLSTPLSISLPEYPTNSIFTDKYILYGNDKFIIPIFNSCYSNEESTNFIVLTSTDCMNWSQHLATTIPRLFASLRDRILDVVFGNGKFIAFQNDRNFYTSTDGISWKQSLTPLPYPCVSAVYDNTKNMFIGTGLGYFIYSNDGETWSTSHVREDGSPSYINIISGENRFLSQSESDGYIAYSDDGMNWKCLIPTVTTYRGTNRNNLLKEAIGINDLQEQINEQNNKISNLDISANDFTTLQEISTFLENHPLKTLGCEIGHLDSSNIKAVLQIPYAICTSNYVGARISRIGVNVYLVVAFDFIAEKFFDCYIYRNNNGCYKTEWKAR